MPKSTKGKSDDLVVNVHEAASSGRSFGAFKRWIESAPDAFDRMLVAQAPRGSFTLVTKDSVVSSYGAPTLW